MSAGYGRLKPGRLAGVLSLTATARPARRVPPSDPAPHHASHRRGAAIAAISRYVNTMPVPISIALLWHEPEHGAAVRNGPMVPRCTGPSHRGGENRKSQRSLVS